MKFQLESDEKLLREAKANLLKGKRANGRGWVFLTNRRIAFCPTMTLFGLGNTISKGRTIQRQFQLKDIVALYPGKGFPKRTMFALVDGTECAIQFVGFFKQYNQPWRLAIREAVCADGASASEDDEGRFEFARPQST